LRITLIRGGRGASYLFWTRPLVLDISRNTTTTELVGRGQKIGIKKANLTGGVAARRRYETPYNKA
jgi:hypothetical protein